MSETVGYRLWGSGYIEHGVQCTRRPQHVPGTVYINVPGAGCVGKVPHPSIFILMLIMNRSSQSRMSCSLFLTTKDIEVQLVHVYT